jgi:sugar phosphate isomerase/epimerase
MLVSRRDDGRPEQRVLRLGISGSSFVRVMPQELVKAAYLDGREGKIHKFDHRQNRLMVDFMRQLMNAVNDSPIQSMECYHSLAWDNEPIMEVLLDNPRVEFWSVHAPYGRYANPSSPIPDERNGALAGILDSIQIARRLGARVVVVHPGVDILYQCPRENMIQHAIQTIGAAAEKAEEAGVMLGIEPLPKREIGNSLEEVLSLVRQIAHPNVGITLDTNHLFPPELVSELLRKAAGLLVNVHISDQDGTERHWLPFEGKLDWKEVIRALADVGYQGPLIYEAHLRGVSNCREVVSRIVENYSRLVEHVLS